MSRMKIGDRYVFKDEDGEFHERTFIESELDMARYFSNNMYCPKTGFSLTDSKRMPKLWHSLNNNEQRHIFELLDDCPIYPTISYLESYLNDSMPDEVLNDLIEFTDPITGEYFNDGRG